jgi:ATP adenylyltransferase
MHAREQFDMAAYVERITTGPCFICEMVKGNPAYRHHLVYEDENWIAFLNKYPTLLGYVLVAPKEHREQVTGDFSEEEYLAFQGLIYRIGEAVRRAVPAERLYLLSLGSQQGNSHVHWHVVPLPPGVPFAEQQLQALRIEAGVLHISEEEMAALAERISGAMVRGLGKDRSGGKREKRH